MALQAEEQAAMDDSKVSTPAQYGLKCMHMHVTCPCMSITENVYT